MIRFNEFETKINYNTVLVSFKKINLSFSNL